MGENGLDKDVKNIDVCMCMCYRDMFLYVSWRHIFVCVIETRICMSHGDT